MCVCVCVWYPSSSFQEGRGKRKRQKGREGGEERGRQVTQFVFCGLKEDGKHFCHDSATFQASVFL